MTGPSGGGSVSGARAVFLIARREFVERIRGKIFIVGTIITVALFTIYTVLQLTVLAHIDTTSTYHVGLTTDAGALSAPLQAAGRSSDIDVQVSHVSDAAAARSAVRSGSLDAVVSGPPTSPDVTVRTQLNSSLEHALTAIVRQAALNDELRDHGLDPAALEASAARASLHVTVLQVQAPGALQQPIIGAILAFLLYLFINIYGGVIAQGVVAEKSSRVIEVLLSTVRASQLLVGKVVGIGAAGLLQLGCIGAAALAMTVPTHVLVLPGAAVGAVFSGVLWFVLGFLLYALMLGATASLVSRVEDAGSATLPVTLFLILAWLLAYAVFLPLIIAVAGGTTPPQAIVNLGTVTSLIPFFSPVLMPIRMAAGVAPAWQVVLAVVLTLLTIAGTVWIGGRMYANSVLRFGGRVRIRDALRRAA